MKLESEPPGGSATVDGKLLCRTTPCGKMLAAGAHEVTFQRPGHGAKAQRIVAAQGLVVKARLERALPAKEPKTGYEFVDLPGGTLVGGQFKGQSVAPFSLGRTAVTVAAYAKCVEAGACAAAAAGGTCNWGTDRKDHPINCLGRDQVKSFCTWLGARLPTPQEREWALGGGEGRYYPWGSGPPTNQLCWNGLENDVGSGKRQSTCPVGAYPEGASKQGLLDLTGNVSELTATDEDAPDWMLCGGSWESTTPVSLAMGCSSLGALDNRPFHGIRCAF